MFNTINSRIERIKTCGRLPAHIAIIMDGNGRWAKKYGKIRAFGHNEGVNSVREILDVSTQLGIKFLTLYTFSTENWKRPKTEVNALMHLLVFTLEKEIRNLLERNVRVQLIGDKSQLPKKVAKAMSEAELRTSQNSGLTLQIALNYSSRDEIIRAIRNVIKDCENKKLKLENINEELFSSYLDTQLSPDPDLVIRTSGEMRVSNFLLWQIAYSEFYITETLWPDFRSNDFLTAIEEYLSRERRFGKITEQLES